MGQKGLTLVNGGSSQGLMEVFSKTVQQHGGTCIGVIPEQFQERDWQSIYTDEKILVKSLAERKDVIKEISDILLVFPGGIGTMDEFFDAWASFSLGFHNKKILLINLEGFYQPLLKQIELFRREQFLHDFLPNPLQVVESIEETISFLEKSLEKQP